MIATRTVRASLNSLFGVPSMRRLVFSILLARMLFAFLMSILPAAELEAKGTGLVKLVLESGALTFRLGVVLSALYFIADFRYGTIDVTVGWVARRWHLLAAKTIAILVVVFISEAIAVAASVLMSYLLITHRSLAFDYAGPIATRVIFGNVFVSVYFALLTGGFAWIFRRIVPTLLVVLSLPIVELIIVSLCSALAGVSIGSWMPLTRCLALASGEGSLPTIAGTMALALPVLATIWVAGAWRGTFDLAAGTD